MATTKDELIKLVRGLDESGAAEMLDYVRWLLSDEDDPLPRKSAPKSSAGKRRWSPATT